MTSALHELTATQIVDGYSKKCFSPIELVTAVLDRVNRCNPKINALVFIEPEQALAEARESETRWRRREPKGLLDGVPVSMKDSIAVAGRPTLRGLRANLGAQSCTCDAPPTARVKEAGGIIFAKTTMPDFGLLASGVSSAFGITRNPWNLAYNPGGSSSGAAASVATFCGPLTVGSDIAGSVRIPAAHCGLVGLKPTQGRIPHLPPSPLRSAGPLSRTVEDTALLLTVLSNFDSRDYRALPHDTTQFHMCLKRDLRGVRIGLITEGDAGANPLPVVLAAVLKAAATFADAGAKVEGIPSVVGTKFMPAYTTLLQIRGLSEFRKLSKPGSTSVPEYFSSWFEKISTINASDVAAAMDELEVTTTRVLTQLSNYDFLITPVTFVSGFPAEALHPAASGATPMYTPIWNQTGNPAISVCCGFDEEHGLPIGLQIIGHRFDDLGVLQIAAAYEKLRGFTIRWPA